MKKSVIFEDKSVKEDQNSNTYEEQIVAMPKEEFQKRLKRAYEKGEKEASHMKRNNPSVQDDVNEFEQEGIDEAIKENAKKREENRQRFKIIADRQDIELFRAESVFPFTVFTDKIIIDTTKISISKRQMFATEYITTIPLKDLGDVNVQTFLFLGTVFIKYMPQAESPGMNDPVTVRIPNLRREAAIRAKNILKGILVAKAEEIDIATLSPDEIKEALHKFGETEGVI